MDAWYGIGKYLSKVLRDVFEEGKTYAEFHGLKSSEHIWRMSNRLIWLNLWKESWGEDSVARDEARSSSGDTLNVESFEF